jgi:Arc/MetJ-type ribon-helix-helix transcriptional regulator
MAEVTVTVPDDMIDWMDAEARRRASTRSAVVLQALRRERERRDPVAIDAATERLREMFRTSAPLDASATVRSDRDRLPDWADGGADAE